MHEEGWTMRWGPEWTLEFIRPDGSRYETGAPKLRDEIRRRFAREEDPPDPPPR